MQYFKLLKLQAASVFLVLSLFLSLQNVLAQQPGSLDASFNPTDKGFGFGDGADSRIFSASVQPDGRIIISGLLQTYNGTDQKYIARLQPNGTLDSTFNTGTGPNGIVYRTLIQPDGKIILSGNFTSISGTSINRIARLHPDGSVDTTFNPGTGPDINPIAIIHQPDGKIIIGGSFTSYNGVTRNSLARLHPDGSLDTAFFANAGTGFSGPVFSLILQPDGKIVAAGNFYSLGTTVSPRLVRLNADGTLDTSFNTGTGADGQINEAVRQPDGKIIIVGAFNNYNGTSRNRIARLNTNGSLDASFNPGTGSNNPIRTVALQPDGKIIIGGAFYIYNGTTTNHLARLNPDGSFDPTYDLGVGTGTSINSFADVHKVVLQPDEKVLLIGEFDMYNNITANFLARIHPNGSFDTAFNRGTGANKTVQSITLQPDGKILISGTFRAYNGEKRVHIARINPDGSLDTTFNPGNGPVAAGKFIKAVVVQADGKIIVGGYFLAFQDTIARSLTRLRTDGTIDPTFNIGQGPAGAIYAAAVQPDGKILVAGEFMSFNGIQRNRMVRLLPSGSVDMSFNPNISGTRVEHIVLQPNGKIMISGDFTMVGSTPRYRVARLNANGTLDTSFDPGVGPNNGITTLLLQPDGKILLGGYFTTFNWVGRNRMVRLETTGAIDTTFNPGTGPNDGIISALVQPDGRIVIGGRFTSYGGISRNYLARLEPTGALDTTFQPGTGADNYILATALQPDGNLLIGGPFTSYNGIGRNRMARIFNNVITAVPEQAQNLVRLYPNPATDAFSIELTKSAGAAPVSVTIYDMLGQLKWSGTFAGEAPAVIPTAALPAGAYLVRIHTNDQTFSGKLILQR